jgi:hypothetical protein
VVLSVERISKLTRNKVAEKMLKMMRAVFNAASQCCYPMMPQLNASDCLRLSATYSSSFSCSGHN